MKIAKSYLKYWPLTFLVISTSGERAHQEIKLCTYGGYKIWNPNNTFLKNSFFSTGKHNKLKQTKNNAIAQNNSGLKHQWVREIFQQFDFDKRCGEREEGQAKLHFPEDTIRGGTKSFCNVKNKKSHPWKYNSDNQRGNIFTTPLRKHPETFFFF